tara:strand:- start:524 stop:1300 length:777 start_codon:yes stop_codon:yes gene_type:complete
MLKKNFIKEKLSQGQQVVGTWSIIPSVISTEILAVAGLDFIIIDSEHGPIGFEKAQEMCVACELHSTSPIIRVSGVNESEILKALDLGAHAIQVPNIRDISQVKELIHYAKYPPIGNRGISNFTRAGMYSLDNAKILPSKANENTMIGINIEDKQAIENIDEILQIKEIDLIFIGLFDLAKSLGKPGQIDDPEVYNYMKSLIVKINKAGKFPGTIAVNPEKAKEFLGLGIKYLLYSVDSEVLRRSYKNIVDLKNSLTS